MLTKDTRVKIDDAGVAADTVSPDSPMKARALFYLDRRLKALEPVAVSHEGMAEIGMSYEARRKRQAVVDTTNEENQHERTALQWLRAQVVEKL